MKRDMKKYKVIHYYPNKSTMEFINIGVLTYSDKEFSYKLLNNDHLEQIHCKFFIEKDVLKNLISYVESLMASIQSINEFKAMSKDLYYDNFSFSKEKALASEHNCEMENSILFEHYIGYKFERAIVVAKKESVKHTAKFIIEKEFRTKFSYKDDNYYDLIIQSKTKAKVFPTIIGSLVSDTDLSVAFRAQLNKPMGDSVYCYINSNSDILRHKEKADHANEILHNRLKMDVIDFSSNDKIYASLDALAG